MEQTGEMSWSETFQDIAKNGLNSAIDRFLGPSTAYEESAQNLPMAGTGGTQDAGYRPYDDTPGQPLQTQGMDNRTLLIGGGVALVLAIGVVYAIAKG